MHPHPLTNFEIEKILSKKAEFLSMWLETLAANILGNALARKRVTRAGENL